MNRADGPAHWAAVVTLALAAFAGLGCGEAGERPSTVTAVAPEPVPSPVSSPVLSPAANPTPEPAPVSAAKSAGILQVSPNPCALGDEGTCSVELSWATEAAPKEACVFVNARGKPLARVRCGSPVAVDWIGKGTFEFQLRSGKEASSAVLDRVEVTGQ